jgi:alpha/beta superfamily hydrolase
MPVKFPCGDITLEGEWHMPAGDGTVPAVVVCHPYPPNGGTMHNNVVMAICEALYEKSIAAFRFNFRGVEGSEGSFDNGIAEQEDVKAAIDFVLAEPRVDRGRIGLAGYSFGAVVSFQVALKDERIKMLALCSAPMRGDTWEQLENYENPKIYLVGDSDQMISIEGFREQLKKSPHPENYKVIAGTDHFWAGYERELASHVAEFFKGGL